MDHYEDCRGETTRQLPQKIGYGLYTSSGSPNRDDIELMLCWVRFGHIGPSELIGHADVEDILWGR